MGKSTAIGTAHTTNVIRYLRDNGFPHAELRNLAGAADKGDIVGCPGVVWECKGGHAAERAGDGLVSDWLIETETERRNAGADIGILVMKRAGIGGPNAGRYWAVMERAALVWLAAGSDWWVSEVDPEHPQPVRLHLAVVVEQLRRFGFGNPL